MDIEELVDNIIEAFESEPDADYGDRETNKYVRERGIRARIWDLVQEYSDERVPTDSDLAQADDEIEELKAENETLKDERDGLRQQVYELKEGLK